MTGHPVQQYVRFFETLQPSALSQLTAHFDPGARFIDPFNDVTGHAAIRRVFEHMFARCESPRFTVDETVGGGPVIYLRWRFTFGPPKRRRHIDGVSRVSFGEDGRAVEHVDYWDPAAQLYETVPLLGHFCRLLRRRLGAEHGQTPKDTAGPTAVTERNET